MKQSAAFLDTSFVVRYLTADPPAMAAEAADLIDSDRQLVLSELALLETAFVLESFYKVARATVVDTLTSLMNRRNIHSLSISKSLALEALRLCRDSRRVSFADALLWAQARHHGATALHTFDRKFPNQDLELRGV